MDLIAWHFVWDNRFLGGLSHSRFFRLACWLPPIAAGLYTYYYVYAYAQAKYDLEVTYFAANDNNDGSYSECARDDAPANEVQEASWNLQVASLKLGLRIFGSIVLSVCLILQTLAVDLIASKEKRATDYT